MSDHRPTGDGHVGDLVSAHLDGELDPGTAASVRAHLATCPDCRELADRAETARAWVRTLPPVDGTQVVERLLARHRATIRAGAAFVGVAAVVLVALGLSAAVIRTEVVPELDDLVTAHDRGAEGIDGDDLTVAMRVDGETTASVFQQPGRLDWDGLPGGRMERIGHRPAWVPTGDRYRGRAVLVAEAGDLVVTVVADDLDVGRTVLDGLPDVERRGAWNRIHDACARLTQTFAGGG